MNIKVKLSVCCFQPFKWYKTLFNKESDFFPHEGFAEWERIQGCWIQIAEGIPSAGSGPLRLAIMDVEAERTRIVRELNVAKFEMHSRKEVPVKCETFSDPWGNRLGFFEYLDKKEQNERIKAIFKLT
ncbi:VOC family protein [Bacillus paramycoides]|nr:VOC family protein [Bacillus paramycoides]